MDGGNGESDFQSSSCMFLCHFCFLTSCLFNANQVYLDSRIQLILYFFLVFYFLKSSNILYSLEAGEKGMGANPVTNKTDCTSSNSKHEILESGKQWAGGRESPLPEIIL